MTICDNSLNNVFLCLFSPESNLMSAKNGSSTIGPKRDKDFSVFLLWVFYILVYAIAPWLIQMRGLDLGADSGEIAWVVSGLVAGALAVIITSGLESEYEDRVYISKFGFQASMYAVGASIASGLAAVRGALSLPSSKLCTFVDLPFFDCAAKGGDVDVGIVAFFFLMLVGICCGFLTGKLYKISRNINEKKSGIRAINFYIVLSSFVGIVLYLTVIILSLMVI